MCAWRTCPRGLLPKFKLWLWSTLWRGTVMRGADRLPYVPWVVGGARSPVIWIVQVVGSFACTAVAHVLGHRRPSSDCGGGQGSWMQGIRSACHAYRRVVGGARFQCVWIAWVLDLRALLLLLLVFFELDGSTISCGKVLQICVTHVRLLGGCRVV